MRFSWRCSVGQLAPPTCSRRSASVSSSFSSRPTCSIGRRSRSSLWIAQWTSTASPAATAAAKRRKSSTMSSGCSGMRGNHGSSPEHLEEARLAEEELRLPTRPEPRRRVSYDREPEPTLLGEDPLALLALVVGEPIAGPPEVHVVDGQGRRDAREHRVLEEVGGKAGHLGEDPADGRPPGLGNREVEDALLGEDDRPLLDVVGEGLFWLGDERRGVRRLQSFGHAHLPRVPATQSTQADPADPGEGAGRALSKSLSITFRTGQPMAHL